MSYQFFTSSILYLSSAWLPYARSEAIHGIHVLVATLPNVHQYKKFTGRLSNKFVKNMTIENFATPQISSNTIPCDVSLITTIV